MVRPGLSPSVRGGPLLPSFRTVASTRPLVHRNPTGECVGTLEPQPCRLPRALRSWQAARAQDTRHPSALRVAPTAPLYRSPAPRLAAWPVITAQPPSVR